MRITTKRVLIGVGAVLGVLVLAVVLFIAFFPKDWALAEAERRIEAATARDLTIGGDVSVSFWPALGFSAEQASLSNPEGFASDTPFIAADKIVFAVAVMPLLRGDIEVRRLIFEGADLRLEAKADGAANWTFPTEATEEHPATLDDLRLDDVRLVGSRIAFQGAEGAPLTLENVDASLKVDSLDTPATLEAAFDYLSRRVDVDATIGAPRAVLEQGETPLTAAIDADALDATFDGAFNAATGALQGQLNAEGGSLRDVLAWIGSPLPDGTSGFGAYSLQAAMAHEGERTALNNAAIRLDAINANGDLNILAPAGGRLRVTGALTAPEIDLNPYLPAPAQGEGGASVNTATAWSTDPLDLSGLRALDAELALSTAALSVQQLKFADVQMALRIANGAADARLSQFAFYGGRGTARMIADGAGATPRIALELNAENVQALPLLTDAIGFDKIEGRGRLTAAFAGAGASQAAIMRSLDGNANFSFNDGAWRGVNLAQIARTIQSALTGAETGQAASTDFAELAASFRIADGLASTEDLRLLNPFVRLDGTGAIDIGGQSLDMRLAPRAVRSAQGQGGDAAAQGLGIPFRVSGAWARPSFRPDVGDIVRNELQRRAQDALRNQEAGSPLGRLGEALFGRQPAAETPAETPATETPASETPAQQPEQPAQQEEQPRNPLGDLFRRAIENQRGEEKQPAPTE